MWGKKKEKRKILKSGIKSLTSKNRLASGAIFQQLKI